MRGSDRKGMKQCNMSRKVVYWTWEVVGSEGGEEDVGWGIEEEG